MYIKDITINVSDIDSELTGELKFRQPKASEVALIQEAYQDQADINKERIAKGLDEVKLSTGPVIAMEQIVISCFLSGKDGDTEITKDDFERAFTNIQSILHIFTKLDGTNGGGLGQENPKSEQISEAVE